MAETKEEKTAVLLAYVEKLQEYTGHKLQLTQADIASLVAIMVFRSYDRKATINKEGQKELYLHFIVKGLVRQYFRHEEKDVTVLFAKEGDIISSCAEFFSDTPSNFRVEALEPTITFAIPKAKLENLYPYSSRINRLARLILSELVLQLDMRELTQLRYTIRERFLLFIRNNPDLFKRVPNKHKASYLDIKPETFSRLKTQLERKVKAIHGN